MVFFYFGKDRRGGAPDRMRYCQRLSSVEYAEQIGKELDVVRMEDIISEQKGKNQVQVGFFL